MSTIQLVIAIALAAFVFGFGGGWYVNDKFDRANVIENLESARKKDAKNVADSKAADRALADEKEKVRTEIKVVKQEIIKYVPQYRTAECPAPTSNETTKDNVGNNKNSLIVASDVLTVGAVRMLNSARSGTTNSAAERSDEKEQAASEVTFEVFLLNDLEVVEQYRELAKDHDTLVEFVEKLMQEQRVRLGLP